MDSDIANKYYYSVVIGVVLQAFWNQKNSKSTDLDSLLYIPSLTFFDDLLESYSWNDLVSLCAQEGIDRGKAKNQLDLSIPDNLES